MGNAAGARFGGAHCAPRAARAGSEVGVSITPNFWDMGQSVKKSRSYKENFVPSPPGTTSGTKKIFINFWDKFFLVTTLFF